MEMIPVRAFGNKTNKKKRSVNIQNTETMLRKYAFMQIEEALATLESRIGGLSSDEAEARKIFYGANIITAGRKNTILHRLFEATVNPFNSILLLIAAITYFTDVVAAPHPDYLTVLIILFLVFISGLVVFIQGERSNAAAEKLSEMITNKADVYRDGKLTEIPIADVVPGDIVRLSAGDMLPAELRFITAKDTFVAQSTLTGESYPIEKFPIPHNEPSVDLMDLSNIGFMGTNIVSGSATGLILSTGNNTYLGSIAKEISNIRAKTSFEQGVGAVSALLLRMMVIIVPIIFLINGLTKGDWGDALLFSISIAVGLTPEMLPVIMTSTLAKGAVTMSQHKVIVRSLGSIQTFGEMDVLCTDKTGTLTEDKIVLEKYINLNDEEDTRILRYAYLNSAFQTGLKNIIDLAIINRATQNGLEGILQNYCKVDEIPFDFVRRRMSVVLTDKNGKHQLITKGAAEEMIDISSFIHIEGKVLPLIGKTRQTAIKLYEKYNREGLRMIAVAKKNDVPESGVFSVADEKNLVLIGFVGFLDPPKESAGAAIKALLDHGVRTVVLTGDNEGVAVKVCGKVGVDVSQFYTGGEVDRMDENALLAAVKSCDLFAKLSPFQKERIVRAFQNAGHTVGYMGDGINDALALRQANVGISVDSAVDIAKETADIILLEKDLMVLEEGVIEGRRTFGNIVKYIKMAASGNFGNIFSVLLASALLPFLPMLPVQFLTQNLLCDFAQMGMPFDSVDEEYIIKPHKWDTKSIKSFMAFMGPLSSIFDILCFAVMWWVIGAKTSELAPLFRSGWFVFGTVSQVLVIYMIRTAKMPFLQSKPSVTLSVSTIAVTVITLFVGFTRFANGIDMMPLPLSFVPWLILILAGYFILIEITKKIYIKRYGEWY